MEQKLLLLGVCILIALPLVMGVDGADLNPYVVQALHLDTNYSDASGKYDATTIGDGMSLPQTSYKLGSGSAYFGYTNDGLNSTTRVPTTGDFSLASWINYTCTDCAWWTQRETSDSAGRLMFYYQYSTYGSRLYLDPTGELFKISKSQPQGVWHFITLTRNSTGFYYYIDGVFNTSVSNSDSICSDCELIYGLSEDLNFDFRGFMDELVYFNKTLSQEEITYLYNSGTGLTYPYEEEEPPIAEINYSENVPYNCDFEDYNVTKWDKTYSTSNGCASTGAPTNPGNWSDNHTYYVSSDTSIWGPDFSAHSSANITTPVFQLNGSEINISFWVNVRLEVNYDGTEIWYNINNTGWKFVNSTSTGGVWFANPRFSTYGGYGGHGTSTTSCHEQAFSNQSTGWFQVNLSSIQTSGNISFRFYTYSDTNTVCSGGTCGTFVDDFSISYYNKAEESPTDSCTYSGSGDWVVTDNCNWTTNTNVLGNLWLRTGIITNLNAVFNMNHNKIIIDNNVKLRVGSGGAIR